MSEYSGTEYSSKFMQNIYETHGLVKIISKFYLFWQTIEIYEPI